jgi:hypothetical protein
MKLSKFVIEALASCSRRTKRLKKISVLFLINDTYTNTVWSTYWAVRKDPRFNVVVAAIESIEKPYAPQIDKRDISKELKKKRIPHKVGITIEQVRRLNPDYIFLTKPYDDYVEADLQSSALSEIGKLINISYGAGLTRAEGEYSFVATNPWMKNAYAKLVESPLSEQSSGKYIFAGYLKMEEIVFADREPQKFGSYTIAWKPRWTMSGTPDFGILLEQFTRLVQAGKASVLFVEHPLFMRFIENQNNHELSGQLLDFLNLGNVRIANGPDFLDSVLRADVLVGDTSSTLAEFLFTGRPIIWTNDDSPILNSVGKRIAEVSYQMKNVTDLQFTIENLISGVDPLAPRRKALFSEIFPHQGRRWSSELIEKLATKTLRRISGA